jgi:hypothetical protein
MDEPEEYKQSKIIEGLYYIETDSYFPLRGTVVLSFISAVLFR